MNILILLRPEIFSIVIMVFLIVYDRYCSQFRRGANQFFKFALAGLGHCIFALVTEITINVDGLPRFVNVWCHHFLFFFALMFSIFYLEYALALVLPGGRIPKKTRAVIHVMAAIAFIIMLAFPSVYLQGHFTRYSHGSGPFLAFGLAFLFLVVADIVIVWNRARIRETAFKFLVPLSVVCMSLISLQLLIPEFFFTAPAMTLMAAALFFAVENPVGKIKSKAFTDQRLQIWNRNCYEYDLENSVLNRMNRGERLVFVVGDANGLKTVNDNLGHVEGDNLLKAIAEKLQGCLKSAYRVYRVGGDEFVALYFDTRMDTVREEVEEAARTCMEIDMGAGIPVGVSMGYARGKVREPVRDTAKRAEKMMYETKGRYYQESGFERRKR